MTCGDAKMSTYTFKKSRSKFTLTHSDEPGYVWETTSKAEVERFIPIALAGHGDWRVVDAFMKEVIEIVRSRRKHKTNTCSMTRGK